MISEKMKKMVEGSSVIRAMFEEGKRMAAELGSENVFDFSLGNPNVSAPEAVKQAIYNVVEGENPITLHGYTNNSGFEDVREKIANHINKDQGTDFSFENIIMTCGAAAGLNVILKVLINPGDEVIVFSPYFGEYRSYVNNYDGILVEVLTEEKTFIPDFQDLKNKLSDKTKAVIINTPNNPTGVIYSEETIMELAEILTKASEKYGNAVYLISDEPYRELVYDGNFVPYVTKYYNNTIVAYSYSKSLSLPGERIGYIVVPDEADESRDIIAAAGVANRIMGFVNAPSLQQKVIGLCLNEETDISYYRRNRDLLMKELTAAGFEYVKPDGAFYLFVKSPEEDDRSFCNKARKYNILMVPGSSFGRSGYVRIAYCVSYETIKNAFPAFKKLGKEYFC